MYPILCETCAHASKARSKGWAYKGPPCPEVCSGFIPAATNTSSPAVATIASLEVYENQTLACAPRQAPAFFA
jgi:hypothetical protein